MLPGQFKAVLEGHLLRIAGAHRADIFDQLAPGGFISLRPPLDFDDHLVADLSLGHAL